MAGQYQYMYQLCVILVSALALVHTRADTQADDSEGTTTIRRGPYVPALVLQNTPVDNTLSEACLAAFHNLTDDPATKFQVMKSKFLLFFSIFCVFFGGGGHIIFGTYNYVHVHVHVWCM